MASKSKARRKVFAASCILAALIVAGSSFAWFTSKDEVTNRLSASADYGVTIAEDFTPPENWVPGQKIDKNVGIVNTGNVDAFVRTWLEGEMRVVKETSTAVEKWDTGNNKFTDLASGVLSTALTAVEDTTLTDLNLNYSVTNGGKTYYLRELTKTQNDNPDPTTPNDNNPDAYSEVMAIQAGGQLVYTTGTKFKYTPNQSLAVQDKLHTIQNIVANTPYTVVVDAASTSAAYNKGINVSGSIITVEDIKYLPSIDSDSFVPATPGLYIFKRNTALNNTLSSDSMEFTGYQYAASVADETAAGETPGSGVYLALHNDENGRSDYTLPSNAVTATYSDPAAATPGDGTWSYAPTTNLQLYTAERTTVANSGLTWTYHAPVAATTGATPTPAEQGYLEAANGDIKINVYLANIKGTAEIAPTGTTGKDTNLKYATTGAESWTNLDNVFYYNNDVEEGCTTERFVDSVELDKSVTKDDYLAFDFDLNVKMESVQVTVGEDGKEDLTAAKSEWTAIDQTGTTATYSNNEISSITWTNVATP